MTSPPTILMLDDELDIMSIFVQALERQFMSLTSQSPLLVRMPVMDGLNKKESSIQNVS
jgi:hypothetical protein